MKIYTRTGDTGKTGLAGGSRIAKDSLPIETVGTIDELNALIGIVCSFPLTNVIQGQLRQIQSRLFDSGAVVASKEGFDCGVTVDAKQAVWLEECIDGHNQNLKELKQFILPGGHPAAAHTHFARTVCRRAERLVVSLQSESSHELDSLLVFLNRLSDYLFVLARAINALHSQTETAWVGASGKENQADS